jgi:hypothetical protein
MRPKRKQPSGWRWLCAAALAVMIGVTGCSTPIGGERQESSPTQRPDDTGPLPSDFEDVRLPRELSLIKDQTFFMQATGFSAGVLSLKGRVDGNSLVTFFESQMRKDNWRLVGFFKSVRSLMMFYKENRWCVISITEKDFYTYAEVWVAPTLHPSESGLLK